MTRIVRKVFAYITNGNWLLVFEHPRNPAAGIQVPAGTMEPEEIPDQAVLREAEEESGLTELKLVSFLGLQTFKNVRLNEVHERYFFHLVATGQVPEIWTNWELHASDSSEPIPFDFFWVQLPNHVPDLIAEHDACF